MVQLITLVLYMLAIFPSHGERDTLFRIASAEAILAATDDVQEQLTLARLQRFESGFARDVARCQRKGDGGRSLGGWQIQPMTPADAVDACGPLPVQAALALRYMRRSAEMCPTNEGAARLNLYVSGHCGYKGPEAVHRWAVLPTGPESYFWPVPVAFGEPANDVETLEEPATAVRQASGF